MFMASEGAEPFVASDSGCFTDYDRGSDRYRIHVKDAFRSDLFDVVQRCEGRGYRVDSFRFSLDRKAVLESETVAMEISYQDVGFFDGEPEVSWEGNESRLLEIENGASVVEAANQYVFVEAIMKILKNIRPDFQWREVATIDKHNRRFWRLLSKPEHSFISQKTKFGRRWAFKWVAGATELPDDLFFDSSDAGFNGVFNPLIASRKVAFELKQKFGELPFFPVLSCISQTGVSVIRVCELLGKRIRQGESS